MPDGRNLSFAPKRGGYLEGKRRWRYLRGYGMLKKKEGNRKETKKERKAEKIRQRYPVLFVVFYCYADRMAGS